MDHLDRLQQPTHERAPPPAPPGPLCFLVFVFPRPPAASGPPGRPLTVESKTLRPGTRLTTAGIRVWLQRTLLTSTAT